MAEHRAPIIGFVWRPQEIVSPITQMAHSTGSRAIFDFSTTAVDAILASLRKTDPAGQVRDIKVSAAALMNPYLGEMLKKTGVQSIWVECHPGFFPADPDDCLPCLKELSQDFHCFPIIGDLNLLAAVLADSSGIGRIVVKGCEALGFVSSETTLTLYSVANEIIHNTSKSKEILIWGGIATPEAAAAFLSTGASGIVFESIHWLTDLVAVDDIQRRRLSNLRLDSSDLVGLDLQVPCRLFNKGNSLAFREIKRFENSLCRAAASKENRRSFADRVISGATHPLESHFTPGDLTPLGVESAFAGSFADRFGTKTEVAVKLFMDQIRSLCRLAGGKKNCFFGQPRSG